MKATSLQVTPRTQYVLSDYITGLAWSPKTEKLAAIAASGEVTLYSTSGEELPLQPAAGLAVNCLSFAADGRFLATAGQSGQLTVWNIAAHPKIWLQQTHASAWIDTLAWHPTLPYLAYGVGQKTIILDVEQRQDVAVLDFQTSSILHLAWQPTGEHLAVSGHGGVKVWPVSDWQAAPKHIQVPGASLHCAWSQDGRYLASGNLDRTLTVTQWNSPPPWLMQGFPGKVRQTAWAKGATRSEAPWLAAACAEGITVWQRESKGKQGWRSQVLQGHRDRVNAIAFHPHSAYLASVGQDGRVCLWHCGQTLVQTLKHGQVGTTCLAWSASGLWLAAGDKAGELSLWQVSRQVKGFG